ncbi:MAG: HyaD/HybD family hydrogenase maturation endopeptidase [Campylobacterota bacterium]|nr:HyaD/HybD family hydrogenase maturation endopeptidase [Campylobacterota bacterium]
MQKNIVIGVGNLLFCDDGIGIMAVEYLKQNYTFAPELEILDGGTLGFGLIDYFLNYDNVYIIDTISTDDKAGEIYRIPSTELLDSGSYKNTAHEVEVVQMLQACQLYEKSATTTIFAITPEDIVSSKIGLSQKIEDNFEKFIEVVVKNIELLGVHVESKNSKTLSQIIEEYNSSFWDK